jgi:hypothetical protein
MYFDGSFTLNGAGGGIVLTSPKGDRLLYVIRLHLYVTNNVVEYKTLINDPRITTELGVHRLYFTVTPSSLSTKSWGSRTTTTPT